MSEVPFTIIGVSTDAVWKMKPMMILKQINEMLKIEFPICSFGAQASLQIVLWTTSEPVRSKFADLECTHGTHASPNPPPRLPDAASAALAQAVALTAATDVAPAFTTKIDGMHPIFATRYDKAAAGLHRRSVQADEPALNAFLSTAADLADMPMCLFCQDDVPSDLKSTTASLLKVTSDEHDELDLSLLDVPDEDDGSAIDAALNLAKGKKFSIDRKEVVYHTDSGVVHALEPRGVKEALASLQRDQWMLAIEKEMDNLRAHDAFHYVPVKEALAQGKKIMRNSECNEASAAVSSPAGCKSIMVRAVGVGGLSVVATSSTRCMRTRSRMCPPALMVTRSRLAPKPRIVCHPPCCEKEKPCLMISAYIHSRTAVVEAPPMPSSTWVARTIRPSLWSRR
jgi:hypothetical protein